MPSEQTKQRIQDTAIKLFAEHGYAAVSLRMLIREADVNQAAINYHFQSKHGVYESLIARYAELTETDRLASLQASNQTKLNDVISALSRPYYEMVHDKEGADMTRFMLRFYQEPSAFFTPLYESYFSEVSKPFVKCLKNFSLNDRQAAFAYSFIIRTMVAQVEDPLAEVLQKPLKRLPSVNILTERNVAICSAAIKALAKTN